MPPVTFRKSRRPERFRRTRNRHHRLVRNHPGAHPSVCRSHGRSPVDPPRSRSRPDGNRLTPPPSPTAFLLSPCSAICHSRHSQIQERRRHDRELRLEPGALSCAGSCRFQDPRPLHPAIAKGCQATPAKRSFPSWWRVRARMVRPAQAMLRGGVGDPLFSVRTGLGTVAGAQRRRYSCRGIAWRRPWP